MSCSTLRPRWTKTACTRCLQWSKTAREHLMQLPILCLWTRKVASPRTVIECKVIKKQNTVTESNTGSLTANRSIIFKQMQLSHNERNFERRFAAAAYRNSPLRLGREIPCVADRFYHSKYGAGRSLQQRLSHSGSTG